MNRYEYWKERNEAIEAAREVGRQEGFVRGLEAAERNKVVAGNGGPLPGTRIASERPTFTYALEQNPTSASLDLRAMLTFPKGGYRYTSQLSIPMYGLEQARSSENLMKQLLSQHVSRAKSMIFEELDKQTQTVEFSGSHDGTGMFRNLFKPARFPYG